jgi:hypothetical protein
MMATSIVDGLCECPLTSTNYFFCELIEPLQAVLIQHIPLQNRDHCSDCSGLKYAWNRTKIFQKRAVTWKRILQPSLGYNYSLLCRKWVHLSAVLKE